MKRININGSSPYDYLIECGLLDRSGDIIRDEVGGLRCLVVTDSNVGPLYLARVVDSLRSAGYTTYSISLPSGEETKSIENYSMLLNWLASHDFERSDVIVALGGGVIGDLAGFTASTFKRGIRLVQCPTSLLAMVDSSVGGKTALDLDAAKNQVGTIYAPALTLCDPSVTETLDEHALMDGYAEVIKYGILSSSDIFDLLRDSCKSGDHAAVIEKSVCVKRDIVEMDEGDDCFRQYLNLGHLAGHAIEAASDYEITHGHAVACGLAIESRACSLSGLSDFSTALQIRDILEEFGFDLSVPFDRATLMPYVLRDKRIRDGRIGLIVPYAIGDCRMIDMDLARLEDVLKIAL